MKITKYVEFAREVEVDVYATDFAGALKESGNSQRDAMQALNNCATIIKGVPDSVVDQLSETQRRVISDFLGAQAARYAPKL